LSDLKEITRTAVLKIYREKGIKAADAKIMDLLVQCETWKDNTVDRGTIKGELSEIYLECHLMWWMQHTSNMLMLKSLCIKSKTSNATAEIDILAATPSKIYLFECKSFKGPKTLTKECFLQGGASSKDVYEQSKYHLELLEQHLAECRFTLKPKTAPYKLILFELSSDEIDDQREDKWKKWLPLLTPNNFDSWFAKEFSSIYPVLWSYDRLRTQLAVLNSTSEAMFKFHMKKINSRKESKL
jgi:hypothetical protein